MAPESGKSDPSLEEILFAQGYRFDFFQAVRLLEAIYPDREPVGRQSRPGGEVVRFHAFTTLSFPPSDIREISPAGAGDQDAPAQMIEAFMGLTGPSGPLPRHYSVMLMERVRRKDYALRDFLDIFNHRLISLFYRAWEKYRFQIGYERVARARNGEYDSFSLHLFDLIGMGTKGLRGRLEFDDRTLLSYVGLLAQHPRSASALGGILSDCFQVKVEVIQFVGQWLEISGENRTQLGPGEANNALGASAVAGNRIWDQQARFTIRVGALSYRDFQRFLPDGTAFKAFVQMIRYCAGQEFDFDLQLVLIAAEVPALHLGGAGSRLGFSSWLKTAEFTRDADQVVFSGGLTQLGAIPQ
jgi:type VI secretion system protein ImpH